MEVAIIFQIIDILAYSFIFLIGLGILWELCAYLIDRFQTHSTLRRNSPFVASFCYSFEHFGGFFRQHFFAQDREEMPLNCAERSWCYRAAKDVDKTFAFGSTRDLIHAGTMFFANCAFPILSEDSVPPSPVTIGPFCNKPYTTNSFIQYFSHEFWCDFYSCHQSPFPWR